MAQLSSSNRKPKALVLLATGTNRDLDVAKALELAGAQPEIVPLYQMRQNKERFADYQMLILPGGFSYADALGAGRVLALDLQAYFASEVNAFVAQGKPVIGICNGFQALVKSGILPGQAAESLPGAANGKPAATLTFNGPGHFECRWVTLAPISQKCVWTRGLAEAIYCPVAHGEGNFVTASAAVTNTLCLNDQVALLYSRPDGEPARGEYPANPNNSVLDIAGVCNPQGNVLGLMPHPENHIFAYQHPRWTRGDTHGSGLPLFANGVRYAAQL